MINDKPLKCNVENGNLVIRIGIDRLAYCARKRHGGLLPNNVQIENALQFAIDTAIELQSEDELGETPIEKCIDIAMLKACENGSTGIKFP